MDDEGEKGGQKDELLVKETGDRHFEGRGEKVGDIRTEEPVEEEEGESREEVSEKAPDLLMSGGKGRKPGCRLLSFLR